MKSICSLGVWEITKFLECHKKKDLGENKETLVLSKLLEVQENERLCLDAKLITFWIRNAAFYFQLPAFQISKIILAEKKYIYIHIHIQIHINECVYLST